MRFVRAELLKYKHTMLNRLLWIAPLLAVIFSYFMGGVVNFQSITSYWWYTFILQGLIAVLCFLSNRMEEVSGNELMLQSLPVSFQKVKWAKHLVLVGKLFVAEMVCMLLTQVCPMLLFPNYAVFSFGQLVQANIVLVLTTMWQIPFCFIIMRFLGKYVAIFGNVILGLLMIIVVGNTKFWIFCPYCWSAKEMEGLLGIGINGVLMETTGIYSTLHLAAIIFSLLLFLLLAKVDAYLYERMIR